MIESSSAARRESGGLAQLARASALHAEGQRFESVILHRVKSTLTVRETDEASVRDNGCGQREETSAGH